MSHRKRTITVAAHVATLLSVGLFATNTMAATPRQAIDALNKQRLAHGIPGDIVENPSWSAGCRLHMDYLARNRLPPMHEENPSLPGYTEAGARAGLSSVLAAEPFGTVDTNPWEHAPIHLMQLLAPALSATGYSDGCMWTWPGYLRPPPAAPLLYAYPGEGTSIYPSQVAREAPYVPGDFVGLPQGTRTGPHLYVLAFGTDDGQIANARLAGHGGDVPVRIVDNTTPTVGSYLPAGGIIIPAIPLASGSRYTASVRFVDQSGLELARSWSFQTFRRSSQRPRLKLWIGSRGVVRVRSRSGSPFVITVRKLPGARVLYRVTRRVEPGTTVSLRLPSGRYRACVRQRANRLYASGRTCRVRQP